MIFRSRKTTLFLLFTLFSLCFSYSQAMGENSLWMIRTQGNTVYLQGSLHLLKNENYPLNAPIEKYFQDSRVLVLEADLRKMTDPGYQQLMATKALLPQGESLEGLLSKNTYDLAKRETAKLGLDISAFRQIKPWMFSMTFSIMKLQLLGFSPQQGLDLYFFSKAMKEGKQILGLESIEDQINMLDGLSYAEQDTLLQQALKDLNILQIKADALVKAWSQGDTEGLETILFESFQDFPSIFDRLITERNRKWLPQIESFLGLRDNVMVIVGVGHLLGEDGLLEMLKRRGYPVKQL